MRKKKLFRRAVVFVLAGVIAAGNAMSAFAYLMPGRWSDDENGRTWIDAGYQMNWFDGTNDDSRAFNAFGGSWVWIDDNADGIAECYYFEVSRQHGQDERYNGYLVRDAVTPDGCTVNAEGEWVVDGVVQTKPAGGAEYKAIRNGVDVASVAGAVTDGRSWPQITFDETLFRAHKEKNGLDLLPERTQNTSGEYAYMADFGPVYSMRYKGKNVTFGTSVEGNIVVAYIGPAGAFFNNLPEQGMELNAFYDNTGYESLSAKRQPMATSGLSDMIFNLPLGSYRMGWGNVLANDTRCNFQIVLTAGEDGKWYIYPDSPMFVNQ